ncbi:SDR family NAD(P)-dependent oxidoreductase, partial [Streptomyces sp. NPDC057307]|uniref:SDR family NAD(P)-dependent oxidoreductase n=1 Tax=Streptomyces sp. NPDC057307 TaxID=3346096 RepID=UPI003638BB2B
MANEDKLRAYLKRVTTDLQQTRDRLHQAESRNHEPIAVVGMACRYPGGARSPEDLWRLVADGTDAITELPAGRGWDLDALYDPDPRRSGTCYTRHGGFLHDADEHDPEFFGINPREALAMDPQQRLLLETSWEVFERAGIDPLTRRGSRTGVFAGVMYNDYGSRFGQAGRIPEGLDGYIVNGSAGSVASGRIAYTFGFEGPAVSVDTACSSSLVALHLAVQALRRGECDQALAGGVCVMSTPASLIDFSRQRGLAKDGRVKAFADGADGTSLGEGAGLLLVERLSDARRLGHTVLAVVRGSAVNQDGRSSQLTAPNGPSQERVIRQALADARLTPADIDAVEAHGTGTSLGDPIEARALLATYGQGRRDDQPLWLGSVKSNIGHAQSAAGVAGVIKMVMAMRHRVLPATLNVGAPTSHVDWTEGAVSVLAEPRPWHKETGPLRAGVSSFGISGTNAHVLLEEPSAADAAGGAPVGGSGTGDGSVAGVGAGTTGETDTTDGVETADATSGSASPTAGPLPWVLSARSAKALAGQAERLLKHLDDEPDARPADIGHALATTRARLSHRAVIVGEDRAEFVRGLSALAAGTAAPHLLSGTAAGGLARTAFLFTGQGSQRPGMGGELHAAFPVYAQAFDAACAQLDVHLATELRHPLRDIVFAAPGTPESALLDETVCTQAALFAVETSLFRLVTSLGVRPDVLIGHSIGELTAAHVSGVLSLDDACALVAARGRLMQALPKGGAMVSLQATEDEVLPFVDDAARRDKVSVAALNGPRAVVVSGDEEAVTEIAAHFGGLGRKTRRLRVSHAFHSPLMDPMLDEFRRVAEGLTYHRPEIPVVTNVTGRRATADELASPEHWVRHVRGAVRFHDGIRHLADDGVTRYLELGPGGVLTAAAQDTLDDAGTGRDDGPATALAPALRKDTGEVRSLLTAVARIHINGATADWDAIFAPARPRRVTLPTYAFERNHYWLNVPPGASDATGLGLTAADHPLLGSAISLADSDGTVLTGRLARDTHPWLTDHAVGGTVILPGAAFVELAIRAGHEVGCDQVAELALEAPLLLPERGGVQIQVLIGAADETGRRAVSVHSRGDDTAADDNWVQHATGQLTTSADPATHAGWDLTTWPPPAAEALAVEDFYDDLAAAGYHYGPAFRGVRAAWRAGEDLYTEVELPTGSGDDGQSPPGGDDAGRFGLHPALLDASLHGIGLWRESGDPQVLPFAWSGVTLHAAGATALRVRLTRRGPEKVTVRVADPAGAPVATVDTLALRPVTLEQLTGAAGGKRRFEDLYHPTWSPLAVVPATGSTADGADTGGWVVLGDVSALPDLGARARTFPDAAALGSAVEDGEQAPELVLLPYSATTTGATTTGAAGPDAVRDLTTHLLGTLQRYLTDERLTGARLAVVTRGAMATDERESADPVHAAVWGLVRTAELEHPGRLLLVDLPASASDLPDDFGTTFPAAVAAVLAAGESQFALRGDTARILRLTRVSGEQAAMVPPAGVTEWRLDTSSRGTLENLVLIPAPEAGSPAGPGQVRVAMRAAGLNFRDVLIALGVYPGDAAMGGEGAGIVIETGEGVTGIAPGDQVVGMFPGSFGPYAVTDQRMITQLPRGWSFEDAASVPIAFLTAYLGLADIARLAPGERVLVHAGAGGVGMAAVQLAKHWGAEVFATASESKWDTLRALGLDDDHIASSRTLDFEEHFRAATGGRGIDVVLDSLAGEFVDASLRLLAAGGRFAEMGKTDIRDAGEVLAEHPRLTLYQAFDLLDLASSDPERIRTMLTDVVSLLDAGLVNGLPVTTWDVRRAPEAFRFMSQARHTGKIVLTLPPAPDTDGTTLVTGGTGGLGAVVARHLVTEHGARHLLLVSRRGPAADGVGELAAELRGLGATVTVAACDVADRQAVSGLLDTIPDEHPLTAVIHAAGLLDDGLLEAQTPERLDTVLRAKADAAWNLHELTQDSALSAFVLFSSVAGVLGNPGQANYGAANAYLDGLASHRRSLGLAGQSLAWGMWADAGGMTGALGTADHQRLARGGIRALSREQGLALFDTALSAEPAVLVPAGFDVPALRARLQRGDAVPAPLRALAPSTGRALARAGAGPTGAKGLAGRLAAMPAAERERFLLDVVRGETAAVLGHASPETVDTGRAFKELGFDSLTAVELRNRLNSATGLTLSSTLIFDHPTPRALTDHIASGLGLLGSDTPDNAATSIAPTAFAADEPVAIVGMACRFPGGVSSPEELWRLVAEGTDAMSGFPTDRGWDLDALFHPDPENSGTSYVRDGGFLHDAGEFDAAFFGISPREALAMDPQQRLLLETAWEALERSGIAPDSLRGTRTGVFAGVMHEDYGAGLAEPGSQAAPELEGYFATSTSVSIASGRISYSLGLEGPAVSVDTACSSSLVALHMAAQSLRQGECTLALAGGVTVMAAPAPFIAFSRQRGLAVDGRCKPFADAADGTGWGEGAGLLVLERLSDAERHGHRVLAVLRGSAVNQDGASNGLTAPNGPSQERVIRQALAGAGLTAAEVDAVEAHGTGTRLGDPIEAQALLATYGQGRAGDRPLYLGSVKSNIGHTQAAAGVAGVIKMVMAIRAGVLPQSLHVDTPSAHVDWTAGAVELLAEARPWPDVERPRRAGVSSFGMSGTNAHVIVEEAPALGAGVAGSGELGVVPWVVSARSAVALRAQALRLGSLAGADPVAVGRALVSSRARFDHRAVLIGGSVEELLAGARALAAGEPSPFVVSGQVRAGAGRTVLVFPGQGSQWAGMAVELAAELPVFRERLDECAVVLGEFTDWGLWDVLNEVEGAASLERVDVVQPVLWAVMVSLAAAWAELGVVPDAVVGHSQGEIAAATVAGVLTLEDGARITALRSKALTALAGTGGMVSVPLPAAEVQAHLDTHAPTLTIATINGPASTVIAGDVTALEEVLAHYEAADVRARRIDVDYASHTPHIDQLQDTLAELLAPVTPQAVTDIAFYSTVTGERVTDTTTMDAAYWYQNLRGTVRFETTTRALLADGYRLFIESSPHPVLTIGIQDTTDTETASDATVIGTLRRQQGTLTQLLTSAAYAHTTGTPINWTRFLPQSSQAVDLPTYPFQRESFWLKSSSRLQDATSLGLSGAEHALLGARIDLADTTTLFTGRLSLSTHPWLADHAVAGTVLLPGAALVDLALHAGLHTGHPHLTELTLHAPLTLDPTTPRQLHLTLEPARDGTRTLIINSRTDTEAEWVQHADGTLTQHQPAPLQPSATWPPPGAEPVDVTGLYEDLHARGYHYGPTFQGLTTAWKHGTDLYADITLPENTDTTGHTIHPALLDAALHTALL